MRRFYGPDTLEVVRPEWIGADARSIVYRETDGPAELLLFRDAEPPLELVHYFLSTIAAQFSDSH